MKHLKFAIALGAIISISACKTYKLPDAKLKPDQVCGYDACQPGNIGTVFHFYKKPFSLEVDNIKTPKDIAASVIGHTFPSSNMYGDRALTCSFQTANPFGDNDVVNLVNPTGRKFDYLRTEKLELDVNSTVKGNMEQIKELNPSNTNLPEIEAKLTAAYTKINNKELSIQGRYSEWGLSRDAIERLIKDDGFEDCKKFLTEKNYRIITAIGLVYFDITFDETNLDKIASDLQADLATQYGVKGDISISFKREVNQNLSASTKGGYQIVVWRHVGVGNLVLLN
ncbi:hypothetical protein [Reichenbachiella sp.]|uniref:hypothetical protein n=1 Tax=Reichenbachiella sp. TaxID=2184521 RepID=UPI003BB20818